jgi:hypothetical protein
LYSVCRVLHTLYAIKYLNFFRPKNQNSEIVDLKKSQMIIKVSQNFIRLLKLLRKNQAIEKMKKIFFYQKAKIG